MEKLQKNNYILRKPKFLSATKTSFLLKTRKAITLLKVTGGNTPNIVLRRMLRSFLKTPPLKNILQFQERICYFIKNTEN